ncbi:hypothetical protein IJI72_00205 [Candidatus Saccharibacteria bacterium]|nr:hypothetical protein [Candidatus Saccharibacteria bacterium]
MDGSYLALFGSITVVGVLVFVSIVLTSKKRYTFDKMEYQTDFLAIENALEKSNRATYNLSIVEADKLLDKALLEMGIPGKTMGERLKRCGREKFSRLESVWRVHKLRNQIAHEPRFSVEYADARRALTIYRQALKDLGAI